MPKILIVEDEPDIAFGLQEDLTRHGYDTFVAVDGDAGVRHGREGAWDVILLDLMLPGRDGFEVCRELRRSRVKTPIIMLTARTQEAEKVLGLELGADDYVTKPFSAAELRARIKAVIRRSAEDSAGVYRFGDCEVDFERGEVRRAGSVVDTTAQEFRLLADRTVYENVALACQISGIWDRAALRERVNPLLDQMGIRGKEKLFPGDLSAGEKQRVALARAMARHPRILIADEPTGNLDPAAAGQIFALLREISSSGTLVAVATHAEEWIRRHPGRVIRLERGILRSDQMEGSAA